MASFSPCSGNKGPATPRRAALGTHPTPPLLPQFNPQRLLPVASHVRSPRLCWEAGTPLGAAP